MNHQIRIFLISALTPLENVAFKYSELGAETSNPSHVKCCVRIKGKTLNPYPEGTLSEVGIGKLSISIVDAVCQLKNRCFCSQETEF
jgi:hypothetical protein